MNRQKIKKVIYLTFSFLLSASITILLILSTLYFALFNPQFIYAKMESTNYFSGKQQEINLALTDLGYASALDESFWENLADKDMISKDSYQYLKNYYNGMSSVVDTSNFENALKSQLDEYITDNNIKNIQKSSIKYLTVRACSIYKSHLEIPLFSKIAYYVVAFKKIIPLTFAGLTAFSIILSLIIFFTTNKKYQCLKYFCYSFSGTFLSIIIVPALIIFKGNLKNINLASPAFYDFFITASNSICSIWAICACSCLIISVILFLIYRNNYSKHITQT